MFYEKGLCKQFIPPIGDYCKMDNVKLTSSMATALTLLEAQQTCSYLEICVGVSGGTYSGYTLNTNKEFTEDTTQNTWFKGDCPDN